MSRAGISLVLLIDLRLERAESFRSGYPNSATFLFFFNNPRAVASSLFAVNVKKPRRIITATKIDAFLEFLPRRLLCLDFVCDRPAGFNFGLEPHAGRIAREANPPLSDLPHSGGPSES